MTINRTTLNTGLGLGPYPNYSRQSFAQNSGSLQASGPFGLLGRQHAGIALLGQIGCRITVMHGSGQKVQQFAVVALKHQAAKKREGVFATGGCCRCIGERKPATHANGNCYHYR